MQQDSALRIAYLCLVVGLVPVAPVCFGQIVAADDAFGLPYQRPLLVEPPGVMANDTHDGNPAAESGGMVILVQPPAFGSLWCEADNSLQLCPDGSFSYSPDTAFPGQDSFRYQLHVSGVVAEATVVLSACESGPVVTFCWQEQAYREQLAAAGLAVISESFENEVVWSDSRSPLTQWQVSSQGVVWQSNHPQPPASNEISTGSGAAYQGQYGIFDPQHGTASGSAIQCDVDQPPAQCFYHDGVTGTSGSGNATLFATGGYFSAVGLANVQALLDESTVVPAGKTGAGFQFFGVISTLPFQRFQWREVDGKVGDPRLLFMDDFILGVISDDLIFAHGFDQVASSGLVWP